MLCYTTKFTGICYSSNKKTNIIFQSESILEAVKMRKQKNNQKIMKTWRSRENTKGNEEGRDKEKKKLRERDQGIQKAAGPSGLEKIIILENLQHKVQSMIKSVAGPEASKKGVVCTHGSERTDMPKPGKSSLSEDRPQS